MNLSEILSRLQVKGGTNIGGDPAYESFLPILDSNGLIPSAMMPPAAMITVQEVADQAARLALTGIQVGDVAKQLDNGITYMLQALPASTDANWISIGDTSVLFAQTVWLTNSGNDTTGSAGRLDKPFLTAQAAYDAASAYQILLGGGTPVVVVVGPGDFGDITLSSVMNTAVSFYGFSKEVSIIGDLIGGANTVNTKLYNITFGDIDGITVDLNGSLYTTGNITASSDTDNLNITGAVNVGNVLKPGGTGVINIGANCTTGTVTNANGAGNAGDININSFCAIGAIDASAVGGNGGNVSVFHNSGIAGNINSSSDGATFTAGSVNLDANTTVVDIIATGYTGANGGTVLLGGTNANIIYVDNDGAAGNNGVITLNNSLCASVILGATGTAGTIKGTKNIFIGTIPVIGAGSLLLDSIFLTFFGNTNCVEELTGDDSYFIRCVFIPDGTGFPITSTTPHTIISYDSIVKNDFDTNVTLSTGSYIIDPNISVM